VKHLPLLKEATQRQHRQLEALPVMRQLLASDFSIDEYRSLLQCQYGLYAHLEGMMAPFLGTLPRETFHWHRFTASSRLASDLRAMGDQPFVPASLSFPFLMSTRSQALGCCYVLLGAGFGARMIAPKLAQSLGPDTPMSFYQDGQPHLKPLWRQLENLLDAASEDGAIQESINAARDTFALFFRAFQGLSHSEHREVLPQ